MSPAETEIAAKVYAAIQHDTNTTARTLQSKDFKVGVSDLGFCSERTRRMLDQQVPDNIDMLPAWIGTALGDHAERAIITVWPDAVLQSTVAITLTGDRGMTYTIGGHPDALLIDEGVVVDVKTVDGFYFVERSGPSQSQQFQRHLYAYAAWKMGKFGDRPLDQIQVANLWLDRSGKTRHAHVQMEPFSQDWVDQAAMWIDDVVYAWVHKEEARKEPPRQMCAKACGFFRTCRAFDTDVEGLITYPEHLTAIDLYLEGAAEAKAARVKTDTAKQVLDGISGSTGSHQLRWMWQNTKYGGYWKIQVDPIPQRKVE